MYRLCGTVCEIAKLGGYLLRTNYTHSQKVQESVISKVGRCMQGYSHKFSDVNVQNF